MTQGEQIQPYSEVELPEAIAHIEVCSAAAQFEGRGPQAERFARLAATLAELDGLRQQNGELFEKLVYANDELAGLRQDKERLDWWESYRADLKQSVSDQWWLLHPVHGYSIARGATLREAIDAARSLPGDHNPVAEPQP